MAQVAFSCDCRGPLSHLRTALQRQLQAVPQQLAAPRTSCGRLLRLQAHAHSCQRAASKVQTPSHTVRKGLQAVNRFQGCSSAVGCWAQTHSDDNQVPSEQLPNAIEGSVAPSAAPQVCKMVLVDLKAAQLAPEQNLICRRFCGCHGTGKKLSL